MSWSNNLVSRYKAARKRWSEINPSQTDPRFWEIDFLPEEGDLSAAQKAVADAIEYHSECSPHAAVLVLLYLLRSRLSNVRLNRLWPEVARLLSSDRLTVDPCRCGNFFRAMLNRLHEERIPFVHNRFVAWCLDQAAIGSDRAEVVAEFLSFLLEQIISRDDEEPAGVAANKLARRFIVRHSDSDEIAVYQSHLQRTGRTIVELTRELKSESLLHELGAWNWQDLRDWWQSHSGDDLDRLTPETRQVLRGLLARWSNRITRSSFPRFLSQSSVTYEVPRVDGDSDPAHSSPLPLGPVRLHLATGARDIQLCDDFGLTSQQICQYRDECWHRIGSDGVFAWSRNPFVIDKSDGTREQGRRIKIWT